MWQKPKICIWISDWKGFQKESWSCVMQWKPSVFDGGSRVVLKEVSPDALWLGLHAGAKCGLTAFHEDICNLTVLPLSTNASRQTSKLRRNETNIRLLYNAHFWYTKHWFSCCHPPKNAIQNCCDRCLHNTNQIPVFLSTHKNATAYKTQMCHWCETSHQSYHHTGVFC